MEIQDPQLKRIAKCCVELKQRILLLDFTAAFGNSFKPKAFSSIIVDRKQSMWYGMIPYHMLCFLSIPVQTYTIVRIASRATGSNSYYGTTL